MGKNTRSIEVAIAEIDLSQVALLFAYLNTLTPEFHICVLPVDDDDDDDADIVTVNGGDSEAI